MTRSTGIAHHAGCPVHRWLRLPQVARDTRPPCTCPRLRWTTTPATPERGPLPGLSDDPFADHLRPLSCWTAPVFPTEEPVQHPTTPAHENRERVQVLARLVNAGRADAAAVRLEQYLAAARQETPR